MKIASPSTNRTKIIVTSVVAILLLGGIVAALEKTGVIDLVKTSPGTSGPTPEQQEEQKKVEREGKQGFIESPDPTPTQNDTSATSIELTAQQEANNSVTILTKLHDIAGGTCTLSITNGNQSHTESAQVIYQPSFSSCAGFSIPKEGLGAGEWLIKLTVSSDIPVEKSITFRVN